MLVDGHDDLQCTLSASSWTARWTFSAIIQRNVVTFGADDCRWISFALRPSWLASMRQIVRPTSAPLIRKAQAQDLAQRGGTRLQPLDVALGEHGRHAIRRRHHARWANSSRATPPGLRSVDLSIYLPMLSSTRQFGLRRIPRGRYFAIDPFPSLRFT